MTTRASVFWFLDKIRKKGEIHRYYDEIIQSLYSEDRIPKQSEAQLNKILEYSVRNIPFYKKFEKYRSIEDFPVINKFTIKGNEDMFLSPLFDKDKLFVESTSGSTGAPLKIYQDPVKRRRARADTIAFSHIAGYEFGTRLYYSRVWNEYNKKSILSSKIQNIIMYDSDKLNDADLQLFLDALERDKTEKSVLIFASTLAALYRYMALNNMTTKAKVKVFITMSESLPKDVRTGIEQIFNTTVISRYSNCECGIMAQQCKDSDEYHVNKSSFYIEILDFETDKHVKEGERGRIVVTDLYNYSMPLIRYDTGDVAVFSSKSECGRGGGIIFKQVDGRRVDCIYSTGGEFCPRLQLTILCGDLIKSSNINLFKMEEMIIC